MKTAVLTIGRLASATGTNVETIRFYEKNGFTALDPSELPTDFPRMAVDDRFYARDLTERGRT